VSEAPFDLETTDRLLSTTRAVRRRLDFDRPVPRDLILDCIRLSQQAPTGTNAQHWRWLVIDDPAKRKAVGELYARGLPLLDEMAKTARDEQTAHVYRDARSFAERLGEVPAIVIPCLEGRLPPDAELVQVTTYYGSIYPAVWSFQLALRSRGLGSTLTTSHLLAEREVGERLGVPSDYTQVALIPVAHIKGGELAPPPRRPVNEVIGWNGW
jgi:nitroreductase